MCFLPRLKKWVSAHYFIYDYMQIDCNNEEIELRITEIEAILDNELYEDEDEKRCLELELQDLENN